jgi:5-formyltetrahydrofolate cyclo-ligase
MHPGHLGVPEPLHPRWLLAADIDVMIVPVVAFDRHLRRLGHGGGNFDRLLAHHTGTKIGVAFEGQRMTVVPVEPHDVPLDLVVTEERAYDGTNQWAALIDAPADAVRNGGEQR